MPFPSEILLTFNEVVLYGDKYGIINDVAAVVEYTDRFNWKVDRVGFVGTYGKFGGHDIIWITSGDMLETVIAKKLTDEWTDYISDRVQSDIDHCWGEVA